MKDCILSFSLLWVTVFLATVSAATAFENHPCKRPCVRDEPPKVCEYNFTVEWYRMLSKACWDCPFKVNDCFRPQCVSGSGKPRPIVAFNRQMPGPSIEVCENDVVVAWVKNELSDGSQTSIHWHGMHQRGTPFMDGVPHITQCGINPGETFRYEFTAFPAGTHWYHSHSGLQMGDGAIGPLIVRKPGDLDPSRPLYDLDLSEHVLMIQDWTSDTANNRFVDLMNDAYINLPMAALINGRTTVFDVPNTWNTSGSPLKSAKTPPSVFHVDKGTRYRFRVISAAEKCPLRLFVHQHKMQIIALDGFSASPVTVDSIMFGPGERFDVVIHADQPVGSYWIRVMGLRDCNRKYSGNATTAVAILKYTNSSDDNPPGDPYEYVPGTLFGPLPETKMRPGYDGDGFDTVTLTQLNSTEGHVNYTGQTPDVVHYIGMDFLQNDNSRFNDKDLYPVTSLPGYKMHLTPTMNNITYRETPIPILSQPEDVDEAWFCNRSTIANMSRCQEDLCKCTHRLLVNTGQMVEIVMAVQEEEGAGHPMHLHGYNFHVLAMEPYEAPFTIEHIEEMDRQGLLKRKLVNPPLKDTINIPNKNYAIIRFRADNPGIWFFHCHIETHLAQGKAMIIQDGHYSQFAPLPEVFPRCGGYGTSNSRKPQKQTTCQKDSSSAVKFVAGVAVLMCAVISQYILF